jgi:hypothetical protein
MFTFLHEDRMNVNITNHPKGMDMDPWDTRNPNKAAPIHN